jgi:hypothetical protein
MVNGVCAEVGEIKNTGFNILLYLPTAYSGPGKYQTLQNI